MKLFLALLVGGLGALFALSRLWRIDGCVHVPCSTSLTEALGLAAALLLFGAFVRAWTLIARSGSWRAVGAAVVFLLGIGLMLSTTFFVRGLCVVGCGMNPILAIAFFGGAGMAVLALLYALWFRVRRTGSG